MAATSNSYDVAVNEALYRLALAVEELAQDVGGDGSYLKRLAAQAMTAVLDVPKPPHEPDNTRGVWCCDEHREEHGP